MVTKIDLSLTESDLQIVICALDDYAFMLRNHNLFTKASYVDSIFRNLHSIKVMSL